MRFGMNELARTFNFYNTEGDGDRRYLIVGRGGVVVYDSAGKTEGRSFAETDPEGKLDMSRNFQTRKMKFDGQKSLVSVHNLGDIKRLGTGGLDAGDRNGLGVFVGRSRFDAPLCRHDHDRLSGLRACVQPDVRPPDDQLYR
ncbi:hypothetical protein [Cohnella rhizosphaerae]|uniref:Uncharacterized protein n=1 Tax=Cohnella rhizosphaerae TaxID=1457232 RepID=A0A9X4KWV7_9BACL|nr:hypothetical protein [Cohnella rhizosphaerae]MDG0812018.1 hypothetical protein [Cohnella rhizosphaerae]